MKNEREKKERERRRGDRLKQQSSNDRNNQSRHRPTTSHHSLRTITATSRTCNTPRRLCRRSGRSRLLSINEIRATLVRSLCLENARPLQDRGLQGSLIGGDVVLDRVDDGLVARGAQELLWHLGDVLFEDCRVCKDLDTERGRVLGKVGRHGIGQLRDTEGAIPTGDTLTHTLSEWRVQARSAQDEFCGGRVGRINTVLGDSILDEGDRGGRADGEGAKSGCGVVDEKWGDDGCGGEGGELLHGQAGVETWV